MAENAPPSVNPADDGSMAGMMRLVLDKFLQNVDDCLPAKVISFDRNKNRATVQPLIMMLTTQNQKVARAQVASVPVFQIGAGGFVLNFNLKPGDFGWLKATDRDISLFMNSFRQTGPNTLRKHSFEDAVFFPDRMRGYNIAEEDAENCVLQSVDGSVKISLGTTKITIAAPEIELVSASLTHNGTNIGDDHRHSGVDTGPSNTGTPV